MKNRQLIPPFVLIALAIIILFAVIFTARSRAQEDRVPNITVVHSGESLTIKWNPVTHEEVRNETADGNVILTIQPKEK